MSSVQVPALLTFSRVHVPLLPAAGITSGPPKAEPVGVVQLLRSSAVWAIIVVNIVNHWGYFIYLNWIPSYFYKVSREGGCVRLVVCVLKY